MQFAVSEVVSSFLAKHRRSPVRRARDEPARRPGGRALRRRDPGALGSPAGLDARAADAGTCALVFVCRFGVPRRASHAGSAARSSAAPFALHDAQRSGPGLAASRFARALERSRVPISPRFISRRHEDTEAGRSRRLGSSHCPAMSVAKRSDRERYGGYLPNSKAEDSTLTGTDCPIREGVLPSVRAFISTSPPSFPRSLSEVHPIERCVGFCWLLVFVLTLEAPVRACALRVTLVSLAAWTSASSARSDEDHSALPTLARR